MKYLYIITMIFVFSGCASTSTMKNQVSKRAAFDLNCKQKISIIELGEKAFGAQGCGKRASYIMRGPCDGIGMCQAVMNSDSKRK